MYVHMRSEPARLAEISLDFAGISARRDEIFPYEHISPVRRDEILNSTHAPDVNLWSRDLFFIHYLTKSIAVLIIKLFFTPIKLSVSHFVM